VESESVKESRETLHNHQNSNGGSHPHAKASKYNERSCTGGSEQKKTVVNGQFELEEWCAFVVLCYL
jgi:hypothetical protein